MLRTLLRTPLQAIWRTRARRTLAIALLFLFAAAAIAYGPGRDPLGRLIFGARPGVRLDGRPVAGLYRHEVRSLLLDMARRIDRDPVNARIVQETGRIVPGQDGLRVNVDATLENVMRARINEDVALVLVDVPQPWDASDLKRLTRLAGSFRTWGYGSAGRWHNIQKALGHINNVLLYPGDRFSFNDHMPPYTRAEGWETAPTIVGTSFVPGLGGGVCQVSTTLYNAVLQAGLAVLERHPHARRVHYVPVGRDAAVAEPHADLKFRNTLDAPVLIRAWLRSGGVNVQIWTTPEARPSPSDAAKPAGTSPELVTGPPVATGC